ncbi:MAG: hypothetical protein K2P86_08870 [Xanthobacteraceae bacterium]|jgi:hypothetical protein|nr:hypothetical protein [Xanthobacteraceae bacterium]
MAYRRGNFALTPPSTIIFALSVVFAVISLLIYYRIVQIPIINPRYVYELLLIGWILLVIGVVFRRV